MKSKATKDTKIKGIKYEIIHEFSQREKRKVING